MHSINRGIGVICFAVITLTLYGCSSNYKSYIPGMPGNSHKVSGLASWYGPGFHGNLTANGERYDQNGISAAHKTLPFDTIVRVTNLTNGKEIDVRINDRGPFIKGRIIDLSKGAAKKIDMIRDGVVPVRLEILRYGG